MWNQVDEPATERCPNSDRPSRTLDSRTVIGRHAVAGVSRVCQSVRRQECEDPAIRDLDLYRVLSTLGMERLAANKALVYEL